MFNVPFNEKENYLDVPSVWCLNSVILMNHPILLFSNTVESRKFEVLWTRDFILKYQKFQLE